tara:strand:+ start:660 stop:1124 length:465 start_codon:yes stop_codon:yes gene_type:complete
MNGKIASNCKKCTVPTKGKFKGNNCYCQDPTNDNNVGKCTLQPDGNCKVPGNDGWGCCPDAYSVRTCLQTEQAITGFANREQHHAIVMYSYIDASGAMRLLTPLIWQRLLNTPRYDAILATLLSGSPEDAHEDLIYLIEQWRDDVDLTKVPFLP